MSDTTDSSKDCGAGTTCAFTDTTIKAGGFDGVYAYAGPEVKPWEQPNEPAAPGPEFFATDTEKRYRDILQTEVIKDLLERIQKLEGQVESLQEDNLDLLGSLDALRDIVEETAKKPTGLFSLWSDNR